MRAIMTAAELAGRKTGENGRDYSLSDDGYGDMEVAERRGWIAVANWGRDGWNLGDWPYVMIYVRNRGGKYELQQVVEGDHTAYSFDSNDDRHAAMDYLFLWYAAGNHWAPIACEQRKELDAGQLTIDDKWRGPCKL